MERLGHRRHGEDDTRRGPVQVILVDHEGSVLTNGRRAVVRIRVRHLVPVVVEQDPLWVLADDDLRVDRLVALDAGVGGDVVPAGALNERVNERVCPGGVAVKRVDDVGPVDARDCPIDSVEPRFHPLDGLGGTGTLARQLADDLGLSFDVGDRFGLPEAVDGRPGPAERFHGVVPNRVRREDQVGFKPDDLLVADRRPVPGDVRLRRSPLQVRGVLRDADHLLLGADLPHRLGGTGIQRHDPRGFLRDANLGARRVRPLDRKRTFSVGRLCTRHPGHDCHGEDSYREQRDSLHTSLCARIQ